MQERTTQIMKETQDQLASLAKCKNAYLDPNDSTGAQQVMAHIHMKKQTKSNRIDPCEASGCKSKSVKSCRGFVMNNQTGKKVLCGKKVCDTHSDHQGTHAAMTWKSAIPAQTPAISVSSSSTVAPEVVDVDARVPTATSICEVLECGEASNLQVCVLKSCKWKVCSLHGPEHEKHKAQYRNSEFTEQEELNVNPKRKSLNNSTISITTSASQKRSTKKKKVVT